MSILTEFVLTNRGVLRKKIRIDRILSVGDLTRGGFKTELISFPTHQGLYDWRHQTYTVIWWSPKGFLDVCVYDTCKLIFFILSISRAWSCCWGVSTAAQEMILDKDYLYETWVSIESIFIKRGFLVSKNDA